MKSFYSFEELGAAFGVRKKARKENPVTCRKCGGAMRHIPGTNVYLCENTIKLPKDSKAEVIGRDKEGNKLCICGNRFFSKKPV